MDAEFEIDCKQVFVVKTIVACEVNGVEYQPGSQIKLTDPWQREYLVDVVKAATDVTPVEETADPVVEPEPASTDEESEQRASAKPRVNRTRR